MNKLNLTCKPILNGIMAYWEGEEKAARYIVSLHIGETEISTRINERTEKYCTFSGLAELDNYKIKVVAEDRNGTVIAESSQPEVEVEDLNHKLNVIIRKLDDVAYAAV